MDPTCCGPVASPLDRPTRLAALGLHLPAAGTHGGNYVSVNVRGNMAFAAIQVPIRDGMFCYQGMLGAGMSTTDGSAAISRKR